MKHTTIDLERLRDREPATLELFYDTYFDRVYNYVRRLVVDEHAAEDLTQDVFLHVHRALPNYDPSKDIRPWLFTIASNKVRDHWRSRARQESKRDTSLDEGSIEFLPSEAEVPEADLERMELGLQVREAIDRLPESMRMTLLLRAYEGLSFEAIGRIVGRSVTAVRKRYSRSLKALKEAVEGIYQVHMTTMG